MIYNMFMGLILIIAIINTLQKNKMIKELQHDINILHTQKARHDLECPLLIQRRVG